MAHYFCYLNNIYCDYSIFFIAHTTKRTTKNGPDITAWPIRGRTNCVAVAEGYVRLRSDRKTGTCDLPAKSQGLICDDFVAERRLRQLLRDSGGLAQRWQTHQRPARFRFGQGQALALRRQRLQEP